jgi:hypothetical protein
LNDVHQADSQEIYPFATLWFSMLRVVKTLASDQTSILLSIFIVFSMVQTLGIHHLSTLLKMEKMCGGHYAYLHHSKSKNCMVPTRCFYIVQNGKTLGMC